MKRRRAGRPRSWRRKDVDARWTKKHGKQTFSYKLSVSTDCRYKLIRTVHVSPANEGDQTHLLKALDRSNSSRDLYADRGYTALGVLEAGGGWLAATHPTPSQAETGALRNAGNVELGFIDFEAMD